MTTLALDGDFNYVDSDTIYFVSGCDETVQNALVRVSISPGESCVFPDAGIDWLSAVMRNERFASARIRSELALVDGVSLIRSLEFQSDENRFSSISANLTIDGQTVELSA